MDVVGSKVKLVLADGSEVEGHIFTVDAASNAVVLSMFAYV